MKEADNEGQLEEILVSKKGFYINDLHKSFIN